MTSNTHNKFKTRSERKSTTSNHRMRSNLRRTMPSFKRKSTNINRQNSDSSTETSSPESILQCLEKGHKPAGDCYQWNRYSCLYREKSALLRATL